MIHIDYTTSMNMTSNDISILFTLKDSFTRVEIKADKWFDIVAEKMNDSYYLYGLANDEFFDETEDILLGLTFDQLIAALHLYLTDFDQFVKQYISNTPTND